MGVGMELLNNNNNNITACLHAGKKVDQLQCCSLLVTQPDTCNATGP